MLFKGRVRIKCRYLTFRWKGTCFEGWFQVHHLEEDDSKTEHVLKRALMAGVGTTFSYLRSQVCEHNVRRMSENQSTDK